MLMDSVFLPRFPSLSSTLPLSVKQLFFSHLEFVKTSSEESSLLPNSQSKERISLKEYLRRPELGKGFYRALRVEVLITGWH